MGGGGLSVSTALPADYDWPSDAFYEKCGSALWGGAWYANKMATNEKMQCVIIVSVLQSVLDDPDNKVEGRPNIRIIPIEHLEPQADKHHYMGLGRFVKVWDLRPRGASGPQRCDQPLPDGE